jgi:hypothetical protein
VCRLGWPKYRRRNRNIRKASMARKNYRKLTFHSLLYLFVLYPFRPTLPPLQKSQATPSYRGPNFDRNLPEQNKEPVNVVG